MGMCGAVDIGQMQQAEMVVAPAIKDRGQVLPDSRPLVGRPVAGPLARSARGILSNDTSVRGLNARIDARRQRRYNR